MLRPVSQNGKGDVCPDHGIRCHPSGTYSYADLRRNLIIDADLVASRIVGHPFKYESHRLNQENSEDALTWNVFRSLQQAGALHHVAELITGQSVVEEPRLFLWGLCLTDDTFVPWDLLLAARRRFESNLPVKRPLTEPDIGLFLPGRYLILVEAKFTSPNPTYTDGPRKNSSSLTKTELIDIYQAPELRILDIDRARAAEKVHYQLWRNMVFAEWMALAGGRDTVAYHANLTRAGFETQSCHQFRRVIRVQHQHRFAHLNWESLTGVLPQNPSSLRRIHSYLDSKTANLHRAFFVYC